MKKIILASGSPRRKELMELIDVPFEVITKNIQEIIDNRLTPAENVKQLAFQKAHAVASEHKNELVMGCDTVVVLEHKILGKPQTESEAFRMLKELSGRTHEVYTGVCLLGLERGINHSFYEVTKVTMKEISDEEIETYIATGEPMDKAGSYGIQGKATVFVSKIEGDYFNIVGLPIQKIYDVLKLLAIQNNFI